MTRSRRLLVLMAATSLAACASTAREAGGGASSGSGGNVSVEPAGGTGGDSPTGAGGAPGSAGGSSGSVDNSSGGASGSTTGGSAGSTTGSTTGGSAGTTSSGGVSGTGGSEPSSNGGVGGGTSVPTPDASSETPPPVPSGDDTGTYNCTLIFGINATSEWFTQGFEKLVDGNKWELVRVHSGFIELWADPNNGFWKTGVTSPCTANANAPDRIIFTALNFDYTTLAEWLPPLTATVKNLRAKYPSAKRIELATFVRAPGNKPCPQREPKRSTIAAAEDQAIEMVAAANPDIVRIAPKFEAKTCDEFSGNPPHPTAAGGMAWSKMIADHYGLGK